MLTEHSTNPEQFEISNSPTIQLVERDLGDTGESSRNFHIFDVYDSEEQIIGMVNVSLEPGLNQAIITDVKVENPYRDEGYGKAIYKKMISYAKENGLQLRSYSSSPNSKGVWESLVREGLAEEIDGRYYAK